MEKTTFIDLAKFEQILEKQEEFAERLAMSLCTLDGRDPDELLWHYPNGGGDPPEPFGSAWYLYLEEAKRMLWSRVTPHRIKGYGMHGRIPLVGNSGWLDFDADYETNTLTITAEGKPLLLKLDLAELEHRFVRPYSINKMGKPLKKLEDFTPEEKRKLRPMAETLAMLDGNAFFGSETPGEREWYESYLPEAHATYEANGGDTGWAGQASFAVQSREALMTELAQLGQEIDKPKE